MAARQFQDGRRQVDQMPWIVAQLAAGRDALRPVHDQRRADAAFVYVGLVQPKRRVGRAGPGGTEAEERLGRAGRRGLVVPSPRIICSPLAPLSETKKIAVFSKRRSP